MNRLFNYKFKERKTMNKAGFLEQTCGRLGRNDAVFAVAAIATFKGIFRPLFTMMDKKQSKDTKEYAALREGVTELIAIPSYIGMSWGVKKLAKPLANDATNIANVSTVKSNLSFTAICFTAVFVIPSLCNLALPSIIKAYKKIRGGNKAEVKTIPISTNPTPIKRTSINAGTTINGDVYSNFLRTRQNLTGMRL